MRSKLHTPPRPLNDHLLSGTRLPSRSSSSYVPEIYNYLEFTALGLGCAWQPPSQLRNWVRI